MKQRFITSIFIVLAVVLVVASKFLPYQIGDYIFDIFIVCISIVAAFEMCNIIEKSERKLNRYLASMYPIFNYIIFLSCNKLTEIYYVLLIQIASLVVYFLIILITEAIRNRNKTPFSLTVKSALNSVLVCLYPSFFFCLFLNINHLDHYAGISGFSIVFIIMVFAITMLSDTFAYLVGRTFKGPKLAPKISPNKTISGGIGGLIGGMAGAMLVYALVYNISSWSIILSMYNITWWHFLIIGLIGSLVSQCGDLLESKIKRNADVKDSGNILPGHGGMLDRIDAMIFCVTFIFIVNLIIVL